MAKYVSVAVLVALVLLYSGLFLFEEHAGTLGKLFVATLAVALAVVIIERIVDYRKEKKDDYSKY